MHTGGLELECTGCLSVAIQFISLGVLQTDMVDIQIMSGSQFHVLDRFLDDGQGLQAQEVHLDQSGFLDHGTLVLGNQHLLAGILVFRRTDRYDIRYIITSDNDTAGVYTRVTDVAFQHLGVFQGIPCQRIISVSRLF